MQQVGILGLGGVGLAVARRMAAAGLAPLGFRRRPAPDFVALGGVVCSSLPELLESCEIIFNAATPEAADDLARASVAVAPGILRGRIVVDLVVGTVDARMHVHDALQRAGVTMLDAPIMGNPPLIEAGRAVVYVSGDRAVARSVEPLLDTIAERAPYVGPFGHGTRLKLASNLLLATHTAAAAEAVAYLHRAGLDARLLIEHLPAIGRSGILDARGAQMVQRRFATGGGSTAMLLEVVETILVDAQRFGCEVPALRAAAALFTRAVDSGLGDADSVSVVEVLR